MTFFAIISDMVQIRAQASADAKHAKRVVAENAKQELQSMCGNHALQVLPSSMEKACLQAALEDVVAAKMATITFLEVGAKDLFLSLRKTSGEVQS